MEWATQEDDNKNIDDGKKEIGDIEMEMQDVGKDQETEKAEQENASATNENEGRSKWDSISCNYSTSPSKEMVNVWEQEIGRLERELYRSTTSEYRKLIEKRINEAQVMLKNSLLKMTVGVDTGNHVKNKDEEKFQEATNMVIDLTRNEQELENSKDITAKKLTTEANDKVSKGKEKTQKDDNHQTVYDARRRLVTFNWAEESDDETVVQQNQTTHYEENWETVKGKKSSKNAVTAEETTTKIDNPYIKKSKKTESETPNNLLSESSTNKEKNNQSSLTTFMEIVKGKRRSENKFSIRVTISFTPRTAGSGEYLRIAREMLSFGKEIDPNILLLPWADTQELGPLNFDDTVNTKPHGDNIRKYIHKPPYVNWRPGSPVYGIGIRFSTNFDKYEFLNRWNLNKQEYKHNNRAAYSITLAPMQKSPSAYIIGIAVGSTEKQDYELLNQKLQAETGIEGIEVSFQNINQAGVTQEFWKLANEQATMVNADKYSREHLREKYLWAPNAIAIYVPTKELVSSARRTMIKKYGKSINGSDPIWPDGSTMRYLPVKGQAIRNEKTRSIVRKRMAYHIWMKVNELSIETNMTNIHQTLDAFDGLTFAEIVLQSTNKDNKRVFSHFNRVWSNDPSNKRWALSVKNHMQEEATTVLENLKDELYDRYGPDIEQFFNDRRTSQNWKAAITGKQLQQDEEDDWFDDDEDIDEVVKNGIVDSTFLRFFKKSSDQEEDKQSVASWGTGNTTYTEIVTTQETVGTENSSITQDIPTMTNEEIEKKKDIVRVRLMIKWVKEKEIKEIMNNKPPYELAFSGIHLPSWDPDKEVLMLLAIRNQFTQKLNNNHE